MRFILEASKGADLLDQHKPRWESRIEINRLDGSSADNCILGQVFGHYTIGVCVLFGSPPFRLLPEAFAHGFTLFAPEEMFIPAGISRQQRQAQWIAAWTAEIEKRQNLRAPAVMVEREAVLV